MLPHASDIGINESFGTSTIANVDVDFHSDLKQSINFNFPADSSVQGRHQLSFVKKSTKKIWDPKLEPKPMYLSSNQTVSVVDHEMRNSNYIPDSSKFILDSTNDKFLNSMFDPTTHNTTSIFTLNKKNVIATNIGQHNNVLAIGFIEEKTSKNKQPTKNTDLKFKSLKSLTFNDQIQQIEYSKIDENTNLLLLRTHCSIYILKLQYNKTLKISKLFHFQKTDKWASFSHASVLVTESRVLLAFVDCVGKFIVYYCEKNAKKMVFAQMNLKNHSFYDPTDLSNYKKLVWINEHRLILMSRLQLHEYRLPITTINDDESDDDEFEEKPEKLFCRICSGTWTKLLDIIPSSIDTNYLYLLTTKEVILVDAKSGFKRCFAWKHFFNESDSSLVLHSLNVQQSETLIISSKKSNINYVMEFDLNHLKIHNYPYLLIPFTSIPSISFSIFKLNNAENSFICLQKLNTSAIVFSRIEYKSVDQQVLEEDRKLHRPQHYNFIKPDRLLSLDVSDVYDQLYEHMTRINKLVPQVTEVTVKIYEKLEEYLSDSTITFSSLFQLIGNTHIPRNIKNTFNIVQHMMKTDKDEEISIRFLNNQWFSDSHINYNLESLDGLNVQSEKVIEFFKSTNNDKTSSDVLLHLMLSLIGVWKTYKSLNDELIEEELDDSVADLPPNYQKMVNSFQDDFNVIGIMDSEEEDKGYTSADPYMGSLLSMPTVSVSQTPPVIGTSQLVNPRPKSKKSFTPIPKSSATLLPKGASLITSKSRGLTPLNSQINGDESQSQHHSGLLSQSQSQISFSQKVSQSGFGMSQSQSRGPKRKKRKTGFQ